MTGTGQTAGRPIRDYHAYSEWLNRRPSEPLPMESWVRIMPPELGGGTLCGQIKFTDGSDHSYAICIPYGEDGALFYVHKADVEACDPPGGHPMSICYECGQNECTGCRPSAMAELRAGLHERDLLVDMADGDLVEEVLNLIDRGYAGLAEQVQVVAALRRELAGGRAAGRVEAIADLRDDKAYWDWMASRPEHAPDNIRHRAAAYLEAKGHQP